MKWIFWFAAMPRPLVIILIEIAGLSSVLVMGRITTCEPSSKNAPSPLPLGSDLTWPPFERASKTHEPRTQVAGRSTLRARCSNELGEDEYWVALFPIKKPIRVVCPQLLIPPIWISSVTTLYSSPSSFSQSHS